MIVDAESGGAKIQRYVFLLNPFILILFGIMVITSLTPLYIKMRFCVDSYPFQS